MRPASASGPPSDAATQPPTCPGAAVPGPALLEGTQTRVGLRDQGDAGGEADEAEHPADRVARCGMDDRPRPARRFPSGGGVDQRPAVDTHGPLEQQRRGRRRPARCRRTARARLTTPSDRQATRDARTPQAPRPTPSGTIASTRDVGATGAFVRTSSRPPTASTRSRMLPRPPGSRRRRGLEPDAVVADHQGHVVAVGGERRPLIRGAPACLTAFCTRLDGSRSRAPPRRPAGSRPMPSSSTIDRDGAGAHGDRAAPRATPSLGEGPRVDARGTGRPGWSIAVSTAASLLGQHRSARSGARSASVCASRRLTTSATRCCWAPSWMSRSSRAARRRGRRPAAPRRLQLLGPQPKLAARRAELGAQPRAAQHQPGLGGQTGEQPLLDRGQGPPSRSCTRSTPSRSPASTTSRGAIGRVAGRRVVGVGVRGPGRGRAPSVVVDRPARPGPTTRRCPRELPRQPPSPGRGARPVVVGAGDGLGEPAQHVVRRAPAVAQPLGHDRVQEPATRLEAERDDGRGEHRQPDVRRVGAGR